MTKREKQLKLIRNRIARWERWREEAIKTLVKAETELPKLGNQLRRMTARDRKLMEQEIARGYQITRAAVEEQIEPPPEDVKDDLIAAGHFPDVRDDLEIPSYLRRDVYDAAKAVANNHNKLASPEAKKLVAQEKRKVKDEHRHADLTGAKRKWPATGKAALAQLK